ncbi:MAG: plasmid mobilization relaxosome protein MobC [Hyphomicrobiales bacterium]|nr:plasmid mobilization relaxosome protein MobC [Hyphomicrobiales bacterium]
MARPKTHSHPRKTHRVTFRMPPEVHARLTATAANAGMTLTDLITERLHRRPTKAAKRTANDDVPPLPPEVFAELRRIGNNVNQIAHAINAGLPPEVQNAYRQASRLLDLLIADEFLLRRKALRMRTPTHDTAHAQTGIELQGSVRLYPARSGTEDS